MLKKIQIDNDLIEKTMNIYYLSLLKLHLLISICYRYSNLEIVKNFKKKSTKQGKINIENHLTSWAKTKANFLLKIYIYNVYTKIITYVYINSIYNFLISITNRYQ